MPQNFTHEQSAIRSGFIAGMSYYQIEQAPRMVQHAPPVRAFGFAPNKTDKVDRTFEVIGFSFIIRGEGRLNRNGRETRIAGPCMLVQLPGRQYRYGPVGAWDEMFVTYAATCLPRFQTPAWTAIGDSPVPLPDRHILLFYRNEILAACRSIHRIASVDRIDSLFASLLLDILAESREKRALTLDRKLYSIKAWIDTHYQDSLSLKEVCAKFLLPERSLLRQWRQTFGDTPGRYIIDLRLRRACDLLVSTDLPIGDVAEESGFSDKLYFSRRFHTQMGMPPGLYRQSNR